MIETLRMEIVVVAMTGFICALRFGREDIVMERWVLVFMVWPLFHA